MTADCRGEQIVCHLALMAPHWAYAALISLALVQQQGLDLAPACEAFGGVSDIAGRGRQHDGITADGRRFTLIDDSYNASPASMAAAIDALGSDPRIGRQAGQRAWQSLPTCSNWGIRPRPCIAIWLQISPKQALIL